MRNRKSIERCEVRRLASNFRIKFRAEAANEFRLTTFCGRMRVRKRRLSVCTTSA
jgi:hypothetical protein